MRYFGLENCVQFPNHRGRDWVQSTSGVRRIVVIGASAGGVEAISSLASQFPADIAAAVFAVLHLPPNATSHLPEILSRAGRLKAVHPVGSTTIERGLIYVAPPDRHLVVSEHEVSAIDGPSEHGHRPAVNRLFRTAAETWGARVIGVVLTGNLDDGTSGLAAVKAGGGVAIVQEPSETIFSGMPRSAIDHVAVDHVLPIDQIVPMIVRLIDEGDLAAGEKRRSPWAQG